MYEDLYKSAPGRVIARLIAAPVFSKAAGAFLGSALSKPLIGRFVKKNNINLAEAAENEFGSFNAFFTRKLKPGSRTVDEAPDALVSPCDGLLSVYKIDSDCHFKVKGSVYTPLLLTQNEQMNARFADGWCLVFRLTPCHYHRYVFPADGNVTMSRRIDGIFHTVRPIALEYVPVFVTNTREYTLCETDAFGPIMQMEVGAAMVGKITNGNHTGKRVSKGDEKGYFEFGGSTIIMFLSKDACELRDDIAHTGETELNIRAGERLNK